MSELALLASFFLFVMGAVASVCGLFLWRTERSEAPAAEVSLFGKPVEGARGQLAALLRLLGEAIPNPFASDAQLQKNLTAAGYRHPAAKTIFYGIRWADAFLLALVLGWVGLLDRQDTSAAVLLAICGLGVGYLGPDRVLASIIVRRAARLEQALPPALDLMVLSVESGQNLDAALFETGRELIGLYPDLATEIGHVQLELRAGRTRREVLHDLGQRNECEELKKLAAVLIDADRFGTSLAPALRTHARYLRIRRRHQAQEAARKLGVKLIFPVFFLIMPSVFVVTLGPAVLQIYQQVIPMFAGAMP